MWASRTAQLSTVTVGLELPACYRIRLSVSDMLAVFITSGVPVIRQVRIRLAQVYGEVMRFNEVAPTCLSTSSDHNGSCSLPAAFCSTAA